MAQSCLSTVRRLYLQPVCVTRSSPDCRYFSSTIRQNARAWIALGSNMGDRLANIENACRRMGRIPRIKLLRTSGLYETKAMYVSQADFLNGVCEIETNLAPLKLLDQLQKIEFKMKRTKIVDKGPRSIDLDILLYDDAEVKHDRLEIPHKLMLEREFVLRPLCDLIPEKKPISSEENYDSILTNLVASTPEAEQAKIKTYLSPTFTINPALPNFEPTIMAILNLTPDSFSDGGLHSPTDRSQLQNTITYMLHAGAKIIDIGGESTRPGSKPVTAADEIARILPAVEIAVDEAHWAGAVVSVDTYRASVATVALRAGAHVINDISSGRLDRKMFATVARFGKSIFLTHMRGTPETMADPKFLDYGDDLIATIGSELSARVDAALAAGIPRWRIAVDPGFGFAKTYEQNVELLERFAELKKVEGLKGLAWVIGVSKKRFVKRMAGWMPEGKHEKAGVLDDFAVRGTAMALKKIVAVGAEVVRVHDVDAVKELFSGA